MFFYFEKAGYWNTNTEEEEAFNFYDFSVKIQIFVLTCKSYLFQAKCSWLGKLDYG